ncbi:hypothetical protein OXPF_11490 [Oxobacter pfennigii]|uniref:DUF2334 domain-containing protein n=1 Tax=Oxobacter pfennigii TaxID=36849 RepID=A0A0P8WC14_9CLOT|nr:hypothetical protein OXPF_11490 [Oxobacter pfennigii]
MMCNFAYRRVLIVLSRIVLCSAGLCFLYSISSYAYEKSPKYILVYKNLYEYGKDESSILNIYCRLKSDGKNVLLLQADNIDNHKIEQGDKIIIVPYSFNYQSEYKLITDAYANNEVLVYGEQNIWSEKLLENKKLFIEIDKIYPFSDLNKVMDMADSLNENGITPVFTVMPVYDNYTLEAYDKYIEVLKYIGKNGGQFFVHEPIINEDGTYNMDSKPLLKRAVEEYRKRGIDIVGIKISMDRLFSSNEIFKDLYLPFILVTEQEGKISSSLDLYKISDMISGHVMITGRKADKYNIFSYMSKGNYIYEDLISLDINKDSEDLDALLDMLRSEKIEVADFKTKNFDYSPDDNNVNIPKEEEKPKTQLDQFKELEIEKIKGSNLEEEKPGEVGYDISQIIDIGIKASVAIICILSIYIYIGRRYDIKKLFK